MNLQEIIDSLNNYERLLKKEQPTKPEMIYVGKTTNPSYACPDCSVLLENYQNYCSYCGQRINWGMPDFLG